LKEQYNSALIQSKIWRILDILRGENITIEDYYVALLFLSLEKAELLDLDSNQNGKEFFIVLETALKGKGNGESFPFLNIIKNFKDSISRLSNRGRNQLILEIKGIISYTDQDEFSKIFDHLLYTIAKSQGRQGGEIIQPVELTRLLINLADLPSNAKVFNPFAGLASFGVYLESGASYFGQELNVKTWAIGYLRQVAYGRIDFSHMNSQEAYDEFMQYKIYDNWRFENTDSITNWPDAKEKFDLIISHPPFGMRINPNYQGIEPGIRTIEQFLVEKGVGSLNHKGKFIALLPQGFLFRGAHEKWLREELIEKDLIDAIIALPGGLLLNTGIPLIVLVLAKNKEIPGKVCFINAEKYAESRNQKEKILDYSRLLDLIRLTKKRHLSAGSIYDSNVVNEPVLDYGTQTSDSRKSGIYDAVRVVDNTRIIELDYNLNVPRYFQKQIDGVKLGDILELVRGQRGNLPETGKLIRIRNLKDDKVDFTLDVSSVEETELRRPDIHLVSESCLLLALRWRTLKPTLFEFKAEPIFRGQDILSFKVNEAIADKAYLISELHADYVQEQLESYRLGASVMPFIRRDDLMEVVIKLPSLEEQGAKVEGINELSDKIKRLQEERNALAHGKTIKQFNEFASLKHTLGRPRQNILDWSDNLLDFFNKKKEGFEALNKAFSEFYDIDIISALKEIKRDVNFITVVLEKGENGLVLSEYEKNLIPLSDINGIINDLSNNGFNFKIKKLLLKGEKLKERGIYANKTLFKTLLDNILTNANKYAFQEKFTGNEVVIELTEVDDSLLIEIRNNGTPFPKNFDRDKFITKYSTANSKSGSGLGGYDINRIASVFDNSDWELILNQDPIYPVKFKFQFPIKLIS